MLSLCINTCRTTPIDPGPIVEKDREEPAIRTELENGPSSISVFRPSPLPPCRVTIHDGGVREAGLWNAIEPRPRGLFAGSQLLIAGVGFYLSSLYLLLQ